MKCACLYRHRHPTRCLTRKSDMCKPAVLDRNADAASDGRGCLHESCQLVEATPRLLTAWCEGFYSTSTGGSFPALSSAMEPDTSIYMHASF